jgi:hypothetical protein
MYRAVDCDEKLAARVVQASCADAANMIKPCTASVDVEMIAERIVASC